MSEQEPNNDDWGELPLVRMRVPTVQDQPRMYLRNWRVVQESRCYFYLFGFHLDSSRYRMTSAVAALNLVQRRWVTASGRIYYTETLPGEPFEEGVLQYLGEFHRLHGELADITDVIWQEMQNALL